MEYQVEVIRSNRRTIAFQIKEMGKLIVRAPQYMKDKEIGRYLTLHEDWVLKHMKKVSQQKNNQMPIVPFTSEELHQMAQEATVILPKRVAYYAKLMGVTYGRITIRNQKTRWGSCSAKGNLNLNLLLMKTPKEVQDYVVVHELCHRKEMNHSKDFWAEVEAVLPEYQTPKKWLKEHGRELIAKLP